MTTATKSFHHTNFGSFGGILPTDNEGYVHLTVQGWIDAGYSRADARERAQQAKEATREAEAKLAEWRAK